MFYYGYKPLFYVIPSYSFTCKLHSHVLMYLSLTHSLPSWLKIQDFFLNSWCRVWPHFMGLKSHKWMKNWFESHLEFDIVLALSWWKSQTVKGPPLFWSQTPSSLVLTIFLNFCILVILLQVDFVFGDEFETIWKSFYEIEDISIFAWFSFLGVEHYHWVSNSIRFVIYLPTTKSII